MKEGVFKKIAKSRRKHIVIVIELQASACNFIKKETLTRVFSCEFSEILKNNFFTEQKSKDFLIPLSNASKDLCDKRPLWPSTNDLYAITYRHTGPYQTSMMEFFCEIFNNFQLLTVFTKISVVDI